MLQWLKKIKSPFPMQFKWILIVVSFFISIHTKAQFVGGQLIPIVDPLVYCGSSGPTIIVDVINPVTGKTWMDRNLGATQVATSRTDTNALGDLYQWGRGNDGHQCRNSPISNVLSSSDQPGNNMFILAPNTPFDWRNPQNINLWQGVNGINNPCPGGYRLPTDSELNSERLSWVQAPINSNNTSVGAFASPLKLTMAGSRSNNNGATSGIGSFGAYWSSVIITTSSRYLYFSNSFANLVTNYRGFGFSVRCIKN